MSMNILIQATQQVQVIKTGKIRERRIQFSAWQTPTKITWDIVNSSKPADVYKDWILANTEDQTEAVFAETDIWEDGEPIGTKVVNLGKEHVAEFDDWLKMCEEEGFEVSFRVV